MKKKKIKIVTIKFAHWWMIFNPGLWAAKKKLEKDMNEMMEKNAAKISDHVANAVLFGKCNGDCGCAVLHPNLRTANQAHSNQGPAKPSADGQSQVTQ